MAPVLACLHHLRAPFLGHAAEPLEAAGLHLDHRHPLRGDPLPALGEVDGILSLGGHESVLDLDRHAGLAAEADLLREAAERGTPVLGVCLGGQLLAHALGGSVRRMERRMVAWAEVEPLPGAVGDPLVARLPCPTMALHWNEDAFEPPAGAVELLTRAGAGCEAFRWGERAWGIQFHPEVDGPNLEGWYRDGRDQLGVAGVGEPEARAADRRHLPGQPATARALFGAFAAEVVAVPSPRA